MNATFGSIDVTPIARRVHAFAIFGQQDHRFVWDAPYLRAKGFRVRVIDNCGHFPYIEQPVHFHDIVKQALIEPAPAHA